ncbi:MAG: hypothetical protein S4CHLAM6_07870 [Chlamydiae bacterium]|nr:hypothetical protein [Chlamydiota bacterium]
MEIPISIQWPQLAGYTVAGALGLQGAICAKNGVKQILISICGNSSLTDRATHAESKNALSSIKNFCFGNASFSSRASLLKEGVENIALAGICGLVSLVVFSKGLAPAPILGPPPMSEADFQNEKKTYSTIFKQVSDISQAAREKIHFFHFVSDYSVSSSCADYLKKDSTFSLSKMPKNQQKEVYYCLRGHILYSVGESAYTSTEEVQNYIESFKNRAQELEQMRNNDLTERSLTLSRTPATNSNQVKAAALDEYRRNILPDLFAEQFSYAFNQFEPLKLKSEKRFEHFIESKMKKYYGPFVLNLNEACDKHLIENAPFKTGFESDCDQYNAIKNEREVVKNYEEGLDSLRLRDDYTNARVQVYEPILDTIQSKPTDFQHLEYGLTASQFEAFKDLHSKYRNNNKTHP